MLDPVAFLKIAVRVALDPALMVAGLAVKLTMVGTVAMSGLLADRHRSRHDHPVRHLRHH